MKKYLAKQKTFSFQSIKQLFLHKQIRRLLFCSFFSLFSIVLFFKMYYQRLGAFGCFDQCTDYVAAYFMLKGRTLYSEIFRNHQMLMTYLSYVIQAILHPATTYQLVLYHRLFVFLFSLVMDLWLIFRFRKKGIAFVLFYETTKYYLFGHLFLPEGLIVYLLAYLLGLSWQKMEKNKLSFFDFLTAGVFTWLVIFLRETCIPMAILLYASLFWGKKLTRAKILSLSLFGLLSLLTLLSVPWPDYFFSLVTVNQGFVSQATQSTGLQGIGWFKIFLYPLSLLFGGQWNHFRLILVGLDLIFLISGGLLAITLKKYRSVGFVILILGLASLRWVEPGTIFYSAFHLLPWYSLFLMAIFLFLDTISKKKKWFPLRNRVVLGLMILFGYTILSPQSFLWEEVDSHEEFTVNYAHPFVYGNVVKTLASKEDKLFLELWYDLIYWQSGLDSSYKYSLYTPAVANFPKYQQARTEMFQKYPPDFYYSACSSDLIYQQSNYENTAPLLPKERVNDYVRLFLNDQPTCLFVKKTKLDQITSGQWNTVKKFGFHLPQSD